MNQRLFKRLILYYNVGNMLYGKNRQNIHKSRQLSIRFSDDSQTAVGRVTRPGSSEQSKAFGGVPFRRG